MKKNKFSIFLAIFVTCGTAFLSGCAILKFAGQTVGAAGKVVSTTGKVVVATVKTTGQIVTATGKTIRTVVHLPGMIKEIKLTRKGNIRSVNAVLNRRVKANLILDTGCSHMQISSQVAEKLRIKGNKGGMTFCTLANGSIVPARKVILKEVRLKMVRVHNVEAVIVDQGNASGYDGLLGMSFLNNFSFKVDPERDVLVLERK